MQYKAFVVEEVENKYITSIKKLEINNLPYEELLIKIHYSSLNYKDALSATGNKGVTKKYPHTPGIDSAGVVVESQSPLFNVGDEVIVTGYDLGMNTPGGFGEYIRVPAEWAVRLPNNLSLKESMIIGTAGFTAGISMLRLTELVKPSDGDIIVSGATGGVGSMALSMLTKKGYRKVALSGKVHETELLKSCGADEIILRNDFMSADDKALFPSTFAGAIDTVGGDILSRIIKSVKPMGAVTTCGSVASTNLSLNVFPFILRAVTLIGISAQNYPTELRGELWSRLANDLKPDNLIDMHQEICLEELPNAINQILKGQIKGRTVIKISE
ncbi:YhdH/YhfP family quinone oxidoreductase [Paludibacter sp.]